MKADELLSILHVAERLKDTKRHCVTSKGRPESVAEHSWRLALMAYLIKDEFPGADMDRVIRMCLIHDLGECFTGDVPVFQKTKADEEKEDALLSQWVSTLPEPFASEMAELYREMEARKTVEARIYKALDGFEALIQHNESPLSSWEDHEYELQKNYAHDRAAFSEYLTELRQAVLRDTIQKIEGK